MDLAGFPVEKLWRAYDYSAKSGADGLVPETNTQDWEFSGEAFDELDGDARFLRRARSWRNDNAFGLAAGNFFDRDFVVAMDLDVATQLAEILSEDRKSTRLNSSHITISYAVFCLKKKNNTNLLRDNS